MYVDKSQYLVELEGYLTALTDSERADVLNFYSEYIDDANLTTHEEIEKSLGTAHQLGRKILADFSIKETEENLGNNVATKTHLNIKMIWLIILVLITSPLTLGIAGMILLIMFAITFSAAAVLIAFFIALIVLFLSSAYIGIGLIFTNLIVATFYIAVAFMCLGGLFILFAVSFLILSWFVQAIANLARFLYSKFSRKRKVQA